jgi:uncharacterized membrane protein YccC
MTLEARHPPRSSMAGWVTAKDPGLLVVKRSVRAAIAMPTVFGATHLLFPDLQISLFGAFGSFALMLLVDFPGPVRKRLASYLALLLVGGGFIALGTVVSTHKAAAVATMAVVGFAVLFVGIVSPNVATASTATLLMFVLPVAVVQPAAAVGPRLLGWACAGALCIPACMLLWPTPWHDELRRRLSSAVSAAGRLAQAHAEGRVDPVVQLAMSAELDQLRDQFAGTPYPPTGAAGGAVALAKLVGRVEWVAGNAAAVNTEDPSDVTASTRTLMEAAAEALERSASLICDGGGHPVDDPVLVDAVQESTRRLDQLLRDQIDVEVSRLTDLGRDSGIVDRGSPTPDAAGFAASLDPSFRARAVGIATEMVADAALEAAGAQAVGDRRLGPTGDAPSLLFFSRVASYLSFRSVWFRNAVRGAAGLALAVAVVEITDVEHGFWVVLGTLSVLRSNALGTGATALRAIGGTVAGFILGSLIMAGVGAHLALLWVLLPVAVLASGVVPSMISFAAGQAGFTVVVIILFNIIDPIGWKVGLTRVEDVAVGCGVSIVVGLLFWPRGATATLGRALADAFVANSGYLADAVDRLTSIARQVDTSPGQRASHRAYLRLDDAFRQYLVERGAKVVPIEVVASLFTGSNRIRLAAYTLASLPELPSDPDRPELETIAVAGAVLRDSYASSHRWYEEFAEVLAGGRVSLDPPAAHDDTLHGALRRAFEDASAQHRGDRLRGVLRMLWADELLETQRQVQADLAVSANLFARRRAFSFMT